MALTSAWPHGGPEVSAISFKTARRVLVEGQVLESLQTVVEEATERMATVKTEAGVPLVEVQDPVEVPRGGRRARARPSLSTLRRHRARPGLCVGRPNNYPSRSSSMSDSRSSCMPKLFPSSYFASAFCPFLFLPL